MSLLYINYTSVRMIYNIFSCIMCLFLRLTSLVTELDVVLFCFFVCLFFDKLLPLPSALGISFKNWFCDEIL